MTALKPSHCPLYATVFAIAIVAHWPAVHGGFVLDDNQLLVNNPFLPGFKGLPALLTSEFFAASGEVQNVPYYRPLSGLLYWLSYQLLGTDAPLQHSLNIALHGLVCALLLRVVLCVTGGRRVASSFVAVMIFATHPATAEIVAYLGGRQDMLGWCIVLSAWGYLAPRGSQPPPRLAGVIACLSTLGAALTREYFLCTPALLLSATLVGPTSRRSDAPRVVVGGALGIGIVWSLRHAVGVQGFALDTIELWPLLSTLSGICARLGQLVFWPNDLSVEVSLPSVGPLAALLTLTSTVAFSVAAVAAANRRRQLVPLLLLGFGIVWTVALLHCPVAQKYGYFADRYGYGCVLATALAVAAVLQSLPPLPRRFGRLAPSVGVLAALTPIPSTWARDIQWRSEHSLQQSMFANRPLDPQSQFAEGMRRFHAEDYEGAYPLCLAYQNARPRSLRAGLCLGTALLRRNRPQQAAAALQPYAYSRPGNLRARVTLFQAWFLADDHEAIRSGLKFYRAYLPNAGDLAAAEQELLRREAERTP